MIFNLKQAPGLSLLACLMMLSACNKSSSPPGETPEYQAWRSGLAPGGLVGDITGGVGTVPITVDFQDFPQTEKEDQWLELAINGKILHRYSLKAQPGQKLVLHYDGPVRQGMLQVKVFYTGTNKGGSLNSETPHGTEIVVTPGGPEGVTITQIATPK